MHQLHRTLGALAALAALAGATAAQAGQVTASASLNPVGTDSRASNGSSTSAAYGTNAHAEVTRTSIRVTTLGDGVTPPFVYGAGGTTNTQYTLWNLASDSALDGGVAAALTLRFNFTLQGTTTVAPVSLSTASVGWDAALYSSGADSAGGSASIVYGPIPPFPSEGYLTTGDAALTGAYDRSFSLLHRHAAGGLWTMGLSSGASHAGDAWSTLGLSGIRLVDGALPGGGLGVRLETGELIEVSPVPEASSHWLLLAGLLSLGIVVRRRAANTA